MSTGFIQSLENELLGFFSLFGYSKSPSAAPIARASTAPTTLGFQAGQTVSPGQATLITIKLTTAPTQSALTIANSIFPKSSINDNQAGFRTLDWQAVYDAALNGAIPAYTAPGCPSNPIPNSPVPTGAQFAAAEQAGGVSTSSLAGTSASLASAIPIPGLAQIIGGIFSFIDADHAAAVRNEQGILCASIPQAQVYLATIMAGWRANQVSPTEAVEAIQQLMPAAVASTQRAQKSSGCDAACWYIRTIKAACMGAVAIIQNSQGALQ